MKTAGPSHDKDAGRRRPNTAEDRSRAIGAVSASRCSSRPVSRTLCRPELRGTLPFRPADGDRPQARPGEGNRLFNPLSAYRRPRLPDPLPGSNFGPWRCPCLRAPAPGLHRLLATAAAVALAGGCAGVRPLMPAPGSNPFSRNEVRSKVEDVRLDLRTNEWSRDPADLAFEVTPILVKINNDGTRDLGIRFSEFTLEDSSGTAYPALPPFNVRTTGVRSGSSSALCLEELPGGAGPRSLVSVPAALG